MAKKFQSGEIKLSEYLEFYKSNVMNDSSNNGRGGNYSKLTEEEIRLNEFNQGMKRFY